jgi:hypothetical protein
MFIDVSEVIAASIIRAMSRPMMEAASTSETSENFYQTTRRDKPEGNHLQDCVGSVPGPLT